MKRIDSFVMLTVFMFTALFTGHYFTSYAANKNVVVVIDPGHGGEGEKNTGAIYNGITEKDITLQLATALKAELEKYDGITVYMTRSSDTFLSLEDRAEYAKSVGADFLFSIHFNASVSHFFYGSEVWTSAFGNYYKSGAEFGNIVSSQWNELGLYQKGVKIKLSSKGQDYYGIIRHSVARNIPAVILEHAYLDHTNDVSMVKTGSFVNQLAVADATAIAKYYHLKSSKTGADFSNFQYATVKKPGKTLRQDETGPDMCNIQVLAQDSANGNILVEMDTRDSHSPVIYFSYSYDGGNNFCPLQMWDRTKNKQSFNVKVPSGTVNPVIVCRSYNSYEKCTESQPVAVTGTFNY